MAMARISAGTVGFLAVAILSGTLCFWINGLDVFLGAIKSCGRLLLYVLPQIVAGMLIGGLAQQLLSRERAAANLGAGSGLGGLVLAAFGGMITPGGPFTSFPLVFALWSAGADIGALVAYLTSWAVLGVNRILVWELPFIGAEFTMLRFLVCLPIPILAGLLARLISARTGLKLGDVPS